MLLITVTSINAQNINGKKEYVDEVYGKSVLIEKKLNSPGEELKIAANHFQIGFGLTVGAVGLGLLSSKISPDSENLINIGAGLLSLVGIVLQVESFSHIRKAGFILNNNGIGIAVKL